MGLTHKFIVELDLVGYSRICAWLEQQVGARATQDLNDQILDFIRAGVAATGSSWADVFYLTTGDGAILGFDEAEQVYLFAVAVNDATRKHNKNREDLIAKRYFRIGAAYGEVALKRTGSEWKLAGMTVARAVRLETAASSGCMMIDHATFNELPARIAADFSRPKPVRGKHDEMFSAHVIRFLSIHETGETEGADKRETESPVELSKAQHACDEDLPTLRRNNIERMRELQSGELIDLVYLLVVPEQEQPSPKDTPAERARSIREWADRNNKDHDLCLELYYLLQRRK